MGTKISVNDLEDRAIDALRALLGEVSVVKLKEVRREANRSTGDIGLVAKVDVLGHSHTLACRINTSAQPEKLRSSLRKLRDGAAQRDEAATPVIIAPYLSPEAQALCKECHAGFLDLEGNARIALGEVFIGKRSIGPHVPQPPADSLAKAMELLMRKQLPPAHGANHAADEAANKASAPPPIAIPA